MTLKNQHGRTKSVWMPSGDTYDPCTAPVLPAPVDANKQLRRQVACLRSRINKGGNEKVLVHYRKVVEDRQFVEANLASKNLPSFVQKMRTDA